MINTLIIEDEARAAQMLADMLKEVEPDLSILEVCSDLPAAVKSIKKNKPDLIFLDVELPVFNGLQLLDFLNEEDISFKIIFTTASNEHAIRAFEMSAVDYILKPIQYDKLDTAVKKFINMQGAKTPLYYETLKDNFSVSGPKKIVIPQSNGFEIIKLDDIMMIKAEGSYAKIYLNNEKSFLVSHNLKYFDDMFQDESNFIRIHRSHLVNLNFAKRIIRNNGTLLVLDNEMQLPVSNEKLETLMGFYNYKKNAQ